MSPTTLPAARQAPGIQGRHVLAAVLGFFGVIFAVNGVMLYHALATHSGVVANEPYRKGLAYNERIAADERQADLRWTADLTVSREGRVAVALADAGGNPVRGLAVAATLGRPSSNRHDVRVMLAEVDPGSYAAATAMIEPGAWIVDVEARGEGNDRSLDYRLRRRLWLKP